MTTNLIFVIQLGSLKSSINNRGCHRLPAELEQTWPLFAALLQRCSSGSTKKLKKGCLVSFSFFFTRITLSALAKCAFIYFGWKETEWRIKYVLKSIVYSGGSSDSSNYDHKGFDNNGFDENMFKLLFWVTKLINWPSFFRCYEYKFNFFGFQFFVIGFSSVRVYSCSELRFIPPEMVVDWQARRYDT